VPTYIDEKDLGESADVAPVYIDEKDLGDAPSEWASAGRGLGQGLSFGLSDELTGGVMGAWDAMTGDAKFSEAYAKHRDEARAANKIAELANPKSYMAGDIAGGVATSLIPVAGLAGRAGMLGKAGASMAKRGVTAGAHAAGQGALEDFGRSEETGGELARDVGIGATIGAATPAVLKGVGKGLSASGKQIRQQAGRFVPGMEKSPKMLNKLYARLAGIGTDKGPAEAYGRVLDDPQLRRQVRQSEDAMADIGRRSEKFRQALTGVEKQVGDQFEALQTKSAMANAADPEYVGAIRQAEEALGRARKLVLENPDYYSKSVLKELKRAQSTLMGKSPKQKARLQAAGHSPESVDLEFGKAITEAKRELDSAFKDAHTRGFISPEKELLRDIYDELNDITRNVGAGATDITDANKLYQQFRDVGKEYHEAVGFNRKKGTINPNKFRAYMQDSGAAGQRAFRQDYQKAALDFLDSQGLDSSELKKIIKEFEPFQLNTELNRLGAQTGATTGRSAGGPLGAVGVGVATDNLAAGAGLGAVAAPATNPKQYLGILNAVDSLVDKMGPDGAKEVLSKVLGPEMVEKLLNMSERVGRPALAVGTRQATSGIVSPNE
jgi:hypothetical protein